MRGISVIPQSINDTPSNSSQADKLNDKETEWFGFFGIKISVHRTYSGCQQDGLSSSQIHEWASDIEAGKRPPRWIEG
jgi:hypothetical protein